MICSVPQRWVQRIQGNPHAVYNLMFVFTLVYYAYSRFYNWFVHLMGLEQIKQVNLLEIPVEENITRKKQSLACLKLGLWSWNLSQPAKSSNTEMFNFAERISAHVMNFFSRWDLVFSILQPKKTIWSNSNLHSPKPPPKKTRTTYQIYTCKIYVYVYIYVLYICIHISTYPRILQLTHEKKKKNYYTGCLIGILIID